MRRRSLRALIIAATVALAAVGVPTAAVAAPPTASCRVVNDWGSGFQGDCTIANPGPDAVNGWTVQVCFTPATVRITQFWNATAAVNNNCVTFTGLSWNSSIPAGGSASFGFIGSPGGAAIGSCTLNGQPCTGSGGGPDSTPPTAPGNLRVTATTSTSVSLAWDASTDNVGVTGYDVLNGNVVLAAGVAGTQATIGNLTADTSYTLTVRAKDAASNMSTPSNQVTARTQPSSGGGSGGGPPIGMTTVSTGWTVPWGIDWLPDGSALVTERDSAQVFRVTSSGQRTMVGTVPNVAFGGEGGLLGLAVSPTFASDQQVYLYHTSSSDNRIVRMTLNGNTLGSYTVIVSGIPRGATFHQGGRLAFGPDGFLYVGTGDAQNSANAQNTSSPAGKILRMTRTGQPAPGNPFGTLVYSYGHRNVQGLAWDSAGRLWEAELGENTADELNLIQPGNNYGWPTCEGPCSVAGMTNPKQTWSPGEASPSGIAIVGNAVFLAGLRGQRLWRIPLSGENTGTPQAFFVNQQGRLRTVVKVPGQNALWLATSNADGRGSAGPGGDVILRVDLAQVDPPPPAPAN